MRAEGRAPDADTGAWGLARLLATLRAVKVTHHYARVNGVRLHYVEAGTGPLVLLLHGFPETHRSWELQLPVLANAGFRVVAPDLRGYGESDKPRSGYDLDTLAADVVELGRALEPGKCRVVGHDWGGAITWHAAGTRPEAFESAVVIDCAHPFLMQEALLGDAEQVKRSWYMFFFQLPVAPELWLSMNGGRNLARMFRSTPGGERAPESMVRAQRYAVGRVSPLRGPLAYYRTALRGAARDLITGRRPARPHVALPVTLIWGELDACFVPRLAEAHRALAPELSLHVLPGVGHFAHQEVPKLVNPLLLRALGSDAAIASVEAE